VKEEEEEEGKEEK